MGDDADGRRRSARDLMARHPELLPDVTGRGPDIDGLDNMERVLLAYPP